MRRFIAVTIAGAVLLAGCSTDSGGEIDDAATSAPIEAPTIPSPDAGQGATLVAVLAEIDSSMGEKPEKTIDRARNMCDSMLAERRGEGGNFTLVETVKKRFIGLEDTDELTDAQAQQIIDAIDAGVWCVEG